MLGLGQASSAPGCANAKCTKIPRPVSWCEAKNEWYKRCDKCRGSGHAKRDAAKAVEMAALQARKGAGELFECNFCGWQPVSEFDVNTETGKPYVNCRKHHAEKLVLSAKHKKTDVGKASEKRSKTSEKGKARAKRANTSVKGKACAKRAKTSEKGKASAKRARTSEKGQATAARFAAKRTKRRQQSSAMRLDNNIYVAAWHLISGRNKTSPTFVERTGVSETALLAHVRAACAAQCLDFDDRKSWQLEHKIPREAYDFDDPANVRCCWSLSNLHVMTKADNMEKSWKLIDHWIASAGPSCFPAAWQGRPPTEDMKRAHAAKMLAAKALVDAADATDLEDEGSEKSEGSEESDESDDSDDEFEQPQSAASGSMQGAGSST
jgi:hypothetical protein